MITAEEIKRTARDKLRDNYLPAVLGAVIYYTPAYIRNMINNVMLVSGMSAVLLNIVSVVLSIVFGLAVMDILHIGYIRSLLKISSPKAIDTEIGPKYDVNIVLSGYRMNFKNTIKVVFFKNLYIFGWTALIMLPYLVCVGVYIFITPPEAVSELYDIIMAYGQSPTPIMMQNIVQKLGETGVYMEYILTGAGFTALALCIPLIRKVYEYNAVAMIVAENPSMPRKEVFATARVVMHGYRFRYFLLQLSFIGFWILTALVVKVSGGSIVVYYIANALITPYIMMAYLEFYLVRTKYL